jgi:hypothetical protein
MRAIWPDGESIPRQRIRDIFRHPPGVPREFTRSGILVGAKGAGKTILLLYHHQVHQGIALNIVLSDVLSSLPKQTAIGPLTAHVPAEMTRSLEAKSSSLLALAIATELASSGIDHCIDMLLACVPPDLRDTTPGLAQLRAKVSRAPLSDFDTTDYVEPLKDYVRTVARIVQDARGPLLLLLDRGDNVASATLRPILHLMNQSWGYVVLLALRPGHGGSGLAEVSAQIIPGDHYDIHQLGVYPRSGEWMDFLLEAVSVQIQPPPFIDSDTKRLITILSRDSTRAALEVFQRASTATNSKAYREAVESAFTDLKQLQLTSAQQLLKPVHPDYRRWLRSVRYLVAAEKPLNAPTFVTFERSSSTRLFDKDRRLTHFLEAAFRSNALTLPPGMRWLLGFVPSEYEIPPLLLWQPSDGVWPETDAPPNSVTMTDSDLFKTGGTAPAVRHIFVAYRMQQQPSVRFVADLRDALQHRPDLRQWRVITGDTTAGADWPNVVRERIKSSELMVADVTGLRSDVLFEAGFAATLGVPIIPAVADDTDHDSLPTWLSATQVASFGRAGGVLPVITSIQAHVTGASVVTTRRLPPPVPALAAFVGTYSWAVEATEQFRAQCRRDDLTPRVFDYGADAQSILRTAAGASLLFLLLNGTMNDALAHYIAGCVVARPNAGAGRLRLPRRVVLLQQPTTKTALAAESVFHCSPIIQVLPLTSVIDEVRSFAISHRDWLKRARGEQPSRKRR